MHTAQLKNQLKFAIILMMIAHQLPAQISQFGGPHRNGVYNETGLLNKWPDQGPELVATLSGIGGGYGSPSVNEQGVFVAGMLDTLGYVFHFNHNHELVWKTKIGTEFNFKYIGARATPTVEENRVYYVTAMGDAACLDATTGKIIWQLNIFKTFNGPKIKWGYTESPLILGDKVFFTSGGPHQNFVALNKMNGETIWTADLNQTVNAYCSPVVIYHNNKALILFNTRDYLTVVNPENGEVLVKHPIKESHDNHALAPIYKDGTLFYSSGYGEGTTLFKIEEGNQELDTIYTNPNLDCKLSALILYEGTVFGTSDNKKQWVGVDYETGKTVFSSRALKPGSFILADHKFYLYTDRGEVALALPSKTGFEVVSRFQIPAENVTFAFAHPVLYDGVLYIRYNNDLWLYNVK